MSKGEALALPGVLGVYNDDGSDTVSTPPCVRGQAACRAQAEGKDLETALLEKLDHAGNRPPPKIPVRPQAECCLFDFREIVDYGIRRLPRLVPVDARQCK